MVDWTSHGETPPSGTPFAADSAQANAPVSSSGIKARSKRNRYISLACNECKRRKIKCNGQTPCQRCGHLRLECLYAPNCCNFKESEEFRSMKAKIDSLQSQINTLYSSVEELYQRKDLVPASAVVSSAQSSGTTSIPTDQNVASLGSAQSHHEEQAMLPEPKRPRYHGPTSNAFSLDVARSSLQSMGIASGSEMSQPSEVDMTCKSSQAVTQLPSFPHLLAHPTKDPLWSVSRQEALRLLNCYVEQVHLMYPFLDLQKYENHINLIFTFLESAERTGLAQRFRPGVDRLNDDETCILKMVLAVALMVENHGDSPLGRRFYEAVKERIADRATRPADLRAVQLMTVCSIFHFVSDDDLMAYRVIGLVARMCLEMGLHREEGQVKASADETELQAAAKLFWAVYTLDRRFAFGTGLPFTFQDDDITCQEPNDNVPLLRIMIPFYRIGSRIWYSGAGVDGALKRDHIEFLDYQLLQWMKSLPEDYRYNRHEPPNSNVPKSILRLRLITYLRANHMRMLIYRPILHSSQSILSNMAWSQTVVDLAKDTIQVLTQMTQECNFYQSIQVLFNYFLLASLAVLLLAVSHAPNHFNVQVRDEFYMALNLVKSFSSKSTVSKRLWKTIRSLHKIGQKLGLLNPGQASDGVNSRQTSIVSGHPSTEYPNDPHTDAAVAMAGMAHTQIGNTPGSYGAIDPTTTAAGNAVFVTTSVAQPQDACAGPMNPGEITNGLLSFFEAMNGYVGYPLGDLPNTAGEPGASGIRMPLNLGNVEGLGEMRSEEELSTIMRDAF